MKYIIDRFEGDYAIVELSDKTIVNIPKAAIPPEAKEGSVIDVTVDKDSTVARSEKINKLMGDLFKQNHEMHEETECKMLLLKQLTSCNTRILLGTLSCGTITAAALACMTIVQRGWIESGEINDTHSR